MKVKLLRDARINHKAGEIVEVSPAERDFLVPLGSAVDAVTETVEPKEVKEEKPAPVAKKTTKKR